MTARPRWRAGRRSEASATLVSSPRATRSALAVQRLSYKPVSRQLAVTASVSVIIPALNEARNLPHVFATLPDWIDEVILVDGRSTDDTIAVARQEWPEVKVVTQAGRGKGDALLAGFGACTGDIIVTMDADGSTNGAEIVRFVAALAAGAELVKGSRFASGGGSGDITIARRCGNKLLCTLVNRLFATRYSDLCYGFNAFWARYLDTLKLDCEGFEVEAMMNIRAAEAGLRVHEVPSFEQPRVHGASNLRIVVDGWRIVMVILREWRRHRQDGPAATWQQPPTVVADLPTASRS